MIKKLIAIICSIALVTTTHLGCCTTFGQTTQCVTIVNKGTHYEISLDFTKGKSHYDVGREFGEKIHKIIPNFEKCLDSYITYSTHLVSYSAGNGYKTFLSRLKDIKLQLDKDYRDEIDGIASTCAGGKNNTPGDNKLSADELYMVNLLPDICRTTQCYAIAAFGSKSATNTTVAGRNLEWFDDPNNDLKNLQAVITFKNGSKSIFTSGFLGYMGVVSGISKNKVFAAILDSNSYGTYSSKMRRSYPFDLRHALENCNTLDEVGDFMKSPTRKYALSHLIFMADPKTSKVLENNISETGPKIRSIRTSTSTLNKYVTWGIQNCIASVNSFILNGNLDNHTTIPYNTMRWERTKELLNSYKKSIDTNAIKQILGCETLYVRGTMQIIVVEPASLKIQIFFAPKNGILPSTPQFEKIPINY